MNVCLLALALALGCATAPGTGVPGIDADPPATADRWLAEDKLRHFALSFAATEMAYAGASFALEPRAAVPAAAATALALGLAKEVRDRRAGGPFSFKDLAWDAAGVALATLLIRQIR